MAQFCAPPQITPVSILHLTAHYKTGHADSLQADLAAFHKAHFSPQSISHFATQFLGPVTAGEDYVEGEEDDGLGYYDDGVKRTLTDEQIAMFRHSEIHALLKEKRLVEEARQEAVDRNLPTPPIEGREDGESIVSEPTSVPVEAKERANNAQNKGKGKKSQKSRKGRHGPSQQKPDLRKRTWDKVDKGLDGLDYGEEAATVTRAPQGASQRRKVSYEDD